MTSCSTLALWDLASVMVNRTYLVPGSRNVNDIPTPVPSSEPSASSVQRYEQGDAAHVEDDPSNETGDPVTGFDGLYVKAATSALPPPLKTKTPPLVLLYTPLSVPA